MTATQSAFPPADVLPPRQGIRLAELHAEPVPRAVLDYDETRPGLSTVVPDGAYKGTMPWTSPGIFLKGLREGLKAHPEKRRIDAKDAMGLDKCMRIAQVETARADFLTGRDMRAFVADIAKAAQCSVEDVRRFHRIASRVMRIMVPIVQGRLLTIFERLDVWARQLSPRLKQHGVTQVWAFNVPDWLRPFMAAAAIKPPPVDNLGRSRAQNGVSATQPRSGDVCEEDHLPYPSPSEPTSSKGGSLRSPRGPGSARAASKKTGRSSPAHQLAEKLVKAWPVLHLTHPRRLEPWLKRFAESRPVWDEPDLLDALQKRGLHIPSTDYGIDTPWAFVKSLLDQLELQDHPRLEWIDAAELRCGRSECDHGWIIDVNSVHELLGLQTDSQRRCDQCRPGAWPDEDLYAGLDDEVPF